MATKKTAVKPAAVAVETEAVVARVAPLKSGDILQQIATLQSNVGSTLAGVAGELAAQLRLRDDVMAAVGAAQERIARLYAIEEVAQDLVEIQRQRDEATALAEADAAEVEAARVRESEEFAYNLNRTRRAEADRYADRIAAERKAEEAWREARLAELDARSEALDAAEEELESHRTAVEGHPEAIRKAVAQAEAILKNSLTRQFEHEKQIAAKDADVARRLAEQEIASLRAQVASLRDANASLQADVKEAHERVKDIAQSSVAASAGKEALNALQSTIATQNQNNGKR